MSRAHLAVAMVAAICVALSLASAQPLPRTDAERARIEGVLSAPRDPQAASRFEARSGGAATNMDIFNQDAFSQPSEGMSFERELMFRVGNGMFRRLWVSAPASTIASDGLGPLFDARGCQRCHLKDGRGHPPEGPDDARTSLVVALGVPADPLRFDPSWALEGRWFETAPEPTYGAQLQGFALPGHPVEARLQVDWVEETVALSGGEIASLRRPVYALTDFAYGPPSERLLISPRVAPPMIGLGLLEAIPTAEILARADPDDVDGDGISGRPHWVESRDLGGLALGRFGVRATTATIPDQVAAAFWHDMGLSSALFPEPWGDCRAAQTACVAETHGGSPQHGGLEVGEEAFDLVVFYSRNLAVPARRDVDDPDVLAGRETFHAVGCASCHTPSHVTARFPDRPDDVVDALTEQSFQLIWPYTDLLPHDLGPGLADPLPQGDASGREWRTPPLWGIGLTETVNGHTYFLHDGRARSLLEAVLWHGGEAQAARDAVVDLAPADRAALIRFLESL